MSLIRSYDKDIEINFTHNVVHIKIRNNIVYILYGLDHIHALFSGIYETCFRFKLQHYARILYGYRKMAAQMFGSAEKMHMTYMKQIIYSNCKYSFSHLFSLPCFAAKLHNYIKKRSKIMTIDDIKRLIAKDETRTLELKKIAGELYKSMGTAVLFLILMGLG